jgi:hypothetical protein
MHEQLTPRIDYQQIFFYYFLRVKRHLQGIAGVSDGMFTALDLPANRSRYRYLSPINNLIAAVLFARHEVINDDEIIQCG